MSYRNRGIIQYTPAQKRAYYAKRSRAAKRNYLSGSGRYTVNKPRGRAYIRGQGKYTIPRNFFSAPKVGGTLGGASGAAIGNMIAPGIGGAIGGALGSGAGTALGHVFKSITGWGDYSIAGNTVLYPDTVVPSFGEDTIRVRKREYICEINGTQDFSITSIPLNPGLDQSFPWLSAIAQNYEQYRFNGIVFQYVSTSSDAIASTTDLGLGQVILATDYNAADDLFINAPQMLGSMFSNSGKPSENILHAIECAAPDQAQKLYYVRTGDPPRNSDIRLYDLGIFQIASQNMPSNYNGMGQLWVTYDVTFCKSVMNNQVGFAINTDKFKLESPAGGTNGTNFGVSQIADEGNNLGCYIDGDTLHFPDTLSNGFFLVNFSVVGSSASVSSPTITRTNCELLDMYYDDTIPNMSNGGSTSSVYMLTMFVTLLGQQASITFGAGGVYPVSATQPYNGDLVITQINGEVTP